MGLSTKCQVPATRLLSCVSSVRVRMIKRNCCTMSLRKLLSTALEVRKSIMYEVLIPSLTVCYGTSVIVGVTYTFKNQSDGGSRGRRRPVMSSTCQWHCSLFEIVRLYRYGSKTAEAPRSSFATRRQFCSGGPPKHASSPAYSCCLYVPLCRTSEVTSRRKVAAEDLVVQICCFKTVEIEGFHGPSYDSKTSLDGFLCCTPRC